MPAADRAVLQLSHRWLVHSQLALSHPMCRALHEGATPLARLEGVRVQELIREVFVRHRVLQVLAQEVCGAGCRSDGNLVACAHDVVQDSLNVIRHLALEHLDRVIEVCM